MARTAHARSPRSSASRREGRAPKNDPALYALALAAGVGDEPTRKAALEALPHVARTGTHLFQFAAFVEGFRGWGRSLRRAVGRWYAAQPAETLAYQAVKYRRREGMTHRDLLRLSHPAAPRRRRQPDARRLGRARSPVRVDRPRRRDRRPAADRRGLRTRAVGDDAARGGRARSRVRPAARGAAAGAPDLGRGLGRAARRHADDGAHPQPRDDDACRRARTGLGRHGASWRSSRTPTVSARRACTRSRCSPRFARTRRAAVSAAATSGARCAQLVDALDAAFYAAFGNVEPTGKRLLLALDVSGSMAGGSVAGVPGLTPRDASAALALVTAAMEKQYEIVGFYAGRRGWKHGRQAPPAGVRTVSRRSRSRRVSGWTTRERRCRDLPFGGTDCALPMLYAHARRSARSTCS